MPQGSEIEVFSARQTLIKYTLRRRLSQAALQALDSVLAHPIMKPFIPKVTERIAPGYSDVIKQPMDLSTVRSKLESSAGYNSAEDTKADIALVLLLLLLNEPLELRLYFDAIP